MDSTNKSEQDQTVEKPLSPVLNRGKIERPFLKRKIKFKKFVPVQKAVIETPTDLDKLFDDSFTLTQNEKILECMEKAEESCFKIPVSPAARKAKIEKEKIPSEVCFKTCSGKTIQISQEKVNVYSKLFDDILNSDATTSTRDNQYNFLSKKDSHNESDICFTQEISDSGISNSQICTVIENTFNKDSLHKKQTLFDFKHLSDDTEKDFKGFDCNEYKQIVERLGYFQELIDQYCSGKSKKRQKEQLKHNPPFKKFKRDSESFANIENVSELFQTASFQNLPDTNYGGFKKASGKAVELNQKALDKAKMLFSHSSKLTEDNLDLVNNENAANLLNSVDINDLPNMNYGGFTKASGKTIELSRSAFDKAKMLFSKPFPLKTKENLDLSNSDETTNLLKSAVTKNLPSTSSGEFTKAVRPTENALNKATISEQNSHSTKLEEDNIDLLNNEDAANLLNSVDINNLPNMNYGGFTKASGKTIELSHTALDKAKMLFSKPFPQKTKGNLDSLNSEEAINLLNLAVIQNLPSTSCGGFTKASGKPVKLTENALNKAKMMFYEEKPQNDSLQNCNKDETNLLNSLDMSLIKNLPIKPSGKPVPLKIYEDSNQKTLENKLRKSDNSSISDSDEKENRPRFKRPRIALNESYDGEDENSATENKLISSIGKRKSLGVSPCKQINIPLAKLAKATLLFDDDSPVKLNPMSPLIFNSTPLPKTVKKFEITETAARIFGDMDFSDLLGNRVSEIRPRFSSTQNGANVVPATPSFSRIAHSSGDFSDNTVVKNFGIVMKEPAAVNLDGWYGELETERVMLQKKLQLLMEKQRILQRFKNGCTSEETRPKIGVLLQAKKSHRKTSLKEFVNSKSPGAEADNQKNKMLLNICPQNAENIHFNLRDITTTKDGATILPNQGNLVGLPEIELSFKSMPGVDSKLIPRNWLRNHYKWIVWKLASYERMFPKEFEGSFTLEHVIQQLKYRYDREIDKAERSALRRIYEKDDVPQKRMVLCVSQILDRKGKYELLLTDGWYQIRTIIDDPLSYQVFTNKIKAGTKLITSGAELNNCDGCHPLEATDLIYLKISYNCTRRAAWYAKLGYQRCANPFPVSIQSLHSDGGIVGCVKVFVARIYPQRYMERENASTVWRNKKAEEQRAQKWEMERNKRIEEIQDRIRKEYCGLDKRKTIGKVKYSKKDIENVMCPISLYEIYENSSDPDRIVELLSSSQKEILMEHQRKLQLTKEQQISEKVKSEIEKFNLNKRNVSGVLRLLILDVNEECETPYGLNVWRPTPGHLQLLKEGSVMSVYNILPRKHGELNTSFKTTFNPEKTNNKAKYEKFQRSVTSISTLLLNKQSTFNEFDTVGIIVKIDSEETGQFLWLADVSGSLLLVKVYEGPKTCGLFDGLKRGQVISLANLVLQEPTSDFVEAIGNHFTIVSRYTQYKHLQMAVSDFEKELPKNLENLLYNCDTKIKTYQIDTRQDCHRQGNLGSSTDVSGAVSEESTLVYSGLTSTDMALSMIDVDKFMK